jgi:hypothetical protein
MLAALSKWAKQRWTIFYDALSFDWKVILHGPSEATEAVKFIRDHRFELAASASLRSVKQLQREGTSESLEGHLLNLVVNEFTTAGRYQAALAYTDYLIETVLTS